MKVNPRFESIWYNTRRIEMPDGSVGTGVLVCYEGGNGSRLVVVTNAHVIDGFTEVVVQELTREKVISRTAEVFAVDYAHDLALLEEVSNEDEESEGYEPEAGLTLGESPVPGDFVTVCGFPRGCETPRLSQGIISGFEDLEIEGHSVRSLVVQAPVNQGSSGGPVCGEEGELVGIVWAMNPRLSPAVKRPSSSTARQAIDYMEQALVPVDGFGYVLDPGDIVSILQAHDQIESYGDDETTISPPIIPISRRAFVSLQRQIADLEDLPAGCSAIGPFNFNWDEDALYLGWHGSEEQIELDAPRQWIDLCRNCLSRQWHFFLRGYKVVAYHRNPRYRYGIWVQRAILDLH